VRASYGEHYDRLAAIKGKYDPNNLFRVKPEHRTRIVTRTEDGLGLCSSPSRAAMRRAAY
jgi:hypothetical protein